MLEEIGSWFGFGEQGRGHGHGHDGHSQAEGDHGHTHGVIDPSIASSIRGIWAIKWSFVILAVTAALQLVVVFYSGSVALLADTIHNIGDAGTAIPLWVAFALVRRKPTPRFTYGLGRVEDLAGIAILAIILFSALVAGYQAIDRLINPQAITQISLVAAAGLIGFIGNEAVGVFRIRVGREISSAALIADGYHARTDGLTSLAVVLGAIGVWLGFPLSDPIVGLLITIAIFGIVWQSAKAILTRSLDGIEPGIAEEIVHAVGHVPGVRRVCDVKARWLGHKLHADVTVVVNDNLTVAEAAAIGENLKKELRAHISSLGAATVQFAAGEAAAADPVSASAHHHAPDPVELVSPPASGRLGIVSAPAANTCG